MKPVYCILLLGLLLAGCKKSKDTIIGDVTVTGILKAQGATYYMYGTYTIENDNEFYALNSKTINLYQYKGKTVTITGNKVAGYPVDGGPDLVNVLSVSP